MKFEYYIYIHHIKNRETSQELGRIAQDIVAINLKLCGHNILEYNPIGRSDIETEFKGVRFVFEVKSGKFELDVKEVKDRISSRVGEKRLVFFDFAFPTKLYVLKITDDLPDDLIVPCSKKYEDSELSKIMNDKLPEAIKKYWSFYNRGGAKVAREFVKDFILTK